MNHNCYISQHSTSFQTPQVKCFLYFLLLLGFFVCFNRSHPIPGEILTAVDLVEILWNRPAVVAAGLGLVCLFCPQKVGRTLKNVEIDKPTE